MNIASEEYSGQTSRDQNDSEDRTWLPQNDRLCEDDDQSEINSSFVAATDDVSLNLCDSSSHSTQNTGNLDDEPERKINRKVYFSSIEVREYNVVIGDNPSCTDGTPISLDWSYSPADEKSIDMYEATRIRPRRTRRNMLLNCYERRDLLFRFGYSLSDIERVEKEIDRERRKRSVTQNFLPIFMVQEALADILEKLRFRSNIRQNDDNGIVESTSRLQVNGQSSENAQDIERGILRRRHFPRNSISSLRCPADRDSFASSASAGSYDLASEDPYQASENSKFDRYTLRVDRSQHDKAIEIDCKSFKRPHMRAFHASWFSFFVAFFLWFSITPLLSEVQDSLELSKEDIWTSSLCGTAGTIVMRILMGPACDKFGARICMVFILIVAAVPTGLTGLVHTSNGLFIVRTFTGIAGSSFVACQYWTSSMFTKEVAGTANALVAGWGNLGGGVANLIIGSALFPLFELMFEDNENTKSSDNTDFAGLPSSEKAWRLVFMVPAMLSFVTAIVIVTHSDDSPKGEYLERVRLQEIQIVSPATSLVSALKNLNVWILSIQYACCFGVEVTMTNANALYFKEEFGQSTVSAAAIASIFGFMNLFARGLGGFVTDVFNAKYGMKGRMYWQFLTLLLQGMGIAVFAYAKSLAGAICALIFTSIMVQSAEGSTFGIVPYVDRRFTGSVVGLVGAGGNVGGVIFAVYFREYAYEKAFLLMGLSAIVASILSFALHIQNHETFPPCRPDLKYYSMRIRARNN
mmetsp:Transcript_29097/g.44694  ORF Transcript_29097/g.44694 Transcript_29097/m.44694 type:complete len:750 (-) Transcript_29097:89-2338(-)